MDRGRDRQMDRSMSSLTERWTNRNTDIGTSGRRDFPPLSPQRGIESLKSTSIGFYLEQWSDGPIDVQTDRQTYRQTDRQTDRPTKGMEGWMDGWMED